MSQVLLPGTWALKKSLRKWATAVCGEASVESFSEGSLLISAQGPLSLEFRTCQSGTKFAKNPLGDPNLICLQAHLSPVYSPHSSPGDCLNQKSGYLCLLLKNLQWLPVPSSLKPRLWDALAWLANASWFDPCLCIQHGIDLPESSLRASPRVRQFLYLSWKALEIYNQLGNELFPPPKGWKQLMTIFQRKTFSLLKSSYKITSQPFISQWNDANY